MAINGLTKEIADRVCDELEAEGFFEQFRDRSSVNNKGVVSNSYTHPDPKINAYNELQYSLKRL